MSEAMQFWEGQPRIIEIYEVVGSGLGNRLDPFQLPHCSPTSAVASVLRSLTYWEGGAGASWRVLEWEADVDGEAGLHRVRFQRRKVTEYQILTDRVAFYYDMSSIAGLWGHWTGRAILVGLTNWAAFTACRPILCQMRAMHCLTNM